MAKSDAGQELNEDKKSIIMSSTMSPSLREVALMYWIKKQFRVDENMMTRWRKFN